MGNVVGTRRRKSRQLADIVMGRRDEVWQIRRFDVCSQDQ